MKDQLNISAAQARHNTEKHRKQKKNPPTIEPETTHPLTTISEHITEKTTNGERELTITTTLNAPWLPTTILNLTNNGYITQLTRQHNTIHIHITW